MKTMVLNIRNVALSLAIVVSSSFNTAAQKTSSEEKPYMGIVRVEKKSYKSEISSGNIDGFY